MLNGAFNYLSEWGTVWEPPQASTIAGESDGLFWFIMWICIFFFFLITALVVFFCVKYRHREGEPQMKFAPAHSTALELTWTFIPTVLVVIIFVYGFKGYIRMSVKPANCREMTVASSMWQWSFVYPNGAPSSDLHMEVGVPVEFVLSSSDVIHDFYVPAFRVKKDIVPGRYNRIWAEPTAVGEYDIYCTQYCGDKHSAMRATVTVESKANYEKFLAGLTVVGTPAEEGQKVWNVLCKSCHNIDGTRLIGPPWKNLYKYPVTFADGTTQIADEAYIRSMIVNPNNKIVATYQPIMPNLNGQLRESKHDIDNVIAFIRTLSDKYTPSPGEKVPASLPTTPVVSDGTPLVSTLKQDEILDQVAANQGDVALGEQLFTRQGCVACHTVKTTDPIKAPCLVDVGKRYKDRRDIAANILDPNLTIAKGFETWRLKMQDDSIIDGFFVREDDSSLTLRALTGVETNYKKDDIAKKKVLSTSLMPPGLVAPLSVHQFASLVDYLESLKSGQ